MIPVFIASATSFQVLTFDDPSTDQDQAENFTAGFTSSSIEATQAGEVAKLRRLVQSLQIGTSATMTITPVADGSEAPGDLTTFSLTALADGRSVVVTSNLDRMCYTARIKVAITAHSGECTLGPSAQWFVSRRSER